MKKSLISYGGILLFYLSLVICIWVVNARFNYLNQPEIKNLYAYNLK